MRDFEPYPMGMLLRVTSDTCYLSVLYQAPPTPPARYGLWCVPRGGAVIGRGRRDVEQMDGGGGATAECGAGRREAHEEVLELGGIGGGCCCVDVFTFVIHMIMITIYKITNTSTGHIFIGRLGDNQDLKQCLQTHWLSATSLNSSGRLYDALRTHPKEEFVLSTVSISMTLDEARLEEFEAILEHRSFLPQHGYNMMSSIPRDKALLQVLRQSDGTSQSKTMTSEEAQHTRPDRVGENKAALMLIAHYRLTTKLSIKDLSKKFNVSNNTVTKIVNGSSYSNVQESLSNEDLSTLSASTKELIRETKLSVRAIAIQFNVMKLTVERLKETALE